MHNWAGDEVPVQRPETENYFSGVQGILPQFKSTYGFS